MTTRISAYLIVEPTYYEGGDTIAGGQVIAVRQKLPKTLRFGARPVRVVMDVPASFWDAPMATATVIIEPVVLRAEATA